MEKGQVVHGSRTAATVICLHVCHYARCLICLEFLKLSTADAKSYYYDYIFIKLLKNNWRQSRRQEPGPCKIAADQALQSLWFRGKSRKKGLWENWRARSRKIGVRCASSMKWGGDKFPLKSLWSDCYPQNVMNSWGKLAKRACNRYQPWLRPARSKKFNDL